MTVSLTIGILGVIVSAVMLREGKKIIWFSLGFLLIFVGMAFPDALALAGIERYRLLGPFFTVQGIFLLLTGLWLRRDGVRNASAMSASR